jgi:hypothetical protein
VFSGTRFNGNLATLLPHSCHTLAILLRPAVFSGDEFEPCYVGSQTFWYELSLPII